MLALIQKDLQIEFRTKETLSSLLLLGLLTLGAFFGSLAWIRIGA